VYRLLVINDGTFEERFSIRLTRMNVLLLSAATFTVVAGVVALLIMFTPLRRLVPGYSDQELRQYAFRSSELADSLQRELADQEAWLGNLRGLLTGELVVDSAAQLRTLKRLPAASDLHVSPSDSVRRQRIGSGAVFDLVDDASASAGRRGLEGIVFFPPLRGVVSQAFDPGDGHTGVDVVTKPDDAVKATLDGTVTLASWTSDGGHVIVVQHRNDLVSIYKHNAVLLKKGGDPVKGGEAIAIVGNSGELSDGPHLHFELWLAGQPIDPQRYIVFQ
jgi:murein DD-endopeptidase MepM/ murein hydrolase activator NlpD